MNSVQRRNHVFSQVLTAEIQRSTFDRSHGLKTTFNAGDLVPVFVDEVLPGDTFNLNMQVFARLATPLFPFMDNLFLESFFFFVPNRLIWDNWEKFNGAQDNPGDSTSYTIPTATVTTGIANGSLGDYFGLPTGINNVTFNNLHGRAYNLIWNTWFRDQNLQNSVTVDTGNGPDTWTNYTILKRGKRHDYFTSALPWPQKGTAVTVPLGTSAPITRVSNAATWKAYQNGTNTLETNGAVVIGGGTGLLQANHSISLDPMGGLIADLSTATAATINQLRQAFQIQRMYERDARGGTRYTEIVLSHFGVHSPDARLQRPEFLGGGRSNVNIHAVPQQSASGVAGTTTKLGDLAAFGVSSGGSHSFTKGFTEHGVLIGLVNVRADMNYQQGLNKMWSRQTRLDYYWPALAHIGEQSVLNQEIYYTDNTGGGIATNIAAFGYQERYGEYRYKPSVITGQFRSNYSTPLDAWHLAYNFGSLPVLNSSFIQEAPPMTRIKAVSTAPDFLLDCYLDLKCSRPMPVYGVPGNIDRF